MESMLSRAPLGVSLSAPKPDTPPSQDELTANWAPDAPIGVSICSITFNQSAFIAEALNGMLAQRHSEPFEIIIHDDASTDGTREIVQEYAERYPRIIRPVLPERNRYSRGISIFAAILPMARGRYIALCEGDDYWIGNNKIRLQSAFLDSAPDCDICSHGHFRIKYDSNGKSVECDRSTYDPGRYNAAELFNKQKAVFPTATIMMRKDIVEDYLIFARNNSYILMEDIYMKFFAARSGGIEVLSETMSIYRAHAPNSWSYTIKRNAKIKLSNSRAKVDSYRALLPYATDLQRSAIENSVTREIESLLRNRRISFRDRLAYACATGFNRNAARGLLAGSIPESLRDGLTRLWT